MANGHVQVRNLEGEVISKIVRGQDPIAALSWQPASTTDDAILVVVDWSPTIALYNSAGDLLREKTTPGDCCALTFSGDMIVTAGSDKSVMMWSLDAVKLGPLTETPAWAWSCAVKQNLVAVGCDDGTIAVHQIQFNTVHGLYNGM
jgi:intraflagellar transport protein 122